MKKILVVDDQLEIREMIVDHFSLRGYHVLSAASVEEGIMLATKEEPDAILLDLGFPQGIQGDELLMQVKRNFPYIKIVMITGESREHVRSRMLNLGADAFFDKGSSLKEIQAEVEKLIASAPEN